MGGSVFGSVCTMRRKRKHILEDAAKTAETINPRVVFSMSPALSSQRNDVAESLICGRINHMCAGAYFILQEALDSINSAMMY